MTLDFQSLFEDKVISTYRVHGGDINETFLVKTSGQDFFVKYNINSKILQAEWNGLRLIENNIPSLVPPFYGVKSFSEGACLLMDYIPPFKASKESYISLGNSVAELHKFSAKYFGLETDNYIGSLDQKNSQKTEFISFYLECRIMPQIEMAYNASLLEKPILSHVNSFSNALKSVVPYEHPSLIHGDLWAGNHIIGENKAYIIDPSVSYNHREMDLAMSLLFGGYPDSFYNGYEEIYPLEKSWRNRMDVYQLYYLLVHLNLFGLGYKESVVRVLKKYR